MRPEFTASSRTGGREFTGSRAANLVNPIHRAKADVLKLAVLYTGVHVRRRKVKRTGRKGVKEDKNTG